MDSLTKSENFKDAPAASRAASNAILFVAAFLATTAALTLACYAAIRVVDPYGEFHSGRFPTVVLDSRRQKLVLFKQYNPRAVTGLIMGSSRSMLLEPRAVDAEFGTRSFNFAVENGHTEDFLAIYRWAVQQGAQPKLIIIGLDVAALHDDGIPDPMFDRVPELKTQMGAAGPGSKPALGFLDRMFELHKVFT